MKTILVLIFLLVFSISSQAMDKDPIFKDPIKDFSVRQNQEFSVQRCTTLKDTYYRLKALLISHPEDVDLIRQMQRVEEELADCPNTSNLPNTKY
jgi:hypothetical protein